MADNAHGFSHLDDQGQARMVDVSGKDATVRVAIARTRVVFNPETFRLLVDKALPKGDALSVAKVAGVLAAKKTSDLIPLCHPLPLSFVDVRFEPREAGHELVIEAEARTEGKTGVEMEALTAASVAALTVYDMCKAVQKDVVIADCRLVFKSGGKSGTFTAE